MIKPGFVELDVVSEIIGVDKVLEVTEYINWLFNGELRDILKTYPFWEVGNLTTNTPGVDEISSGWIKLLFWVILNMKLSFGHLFDNPKPVNATFPPWVEITVELDDKTALIFRIKPFD